MATYFEQLAAELPAIRTLATRVDAIGFFAQEVLRFHSIAGTLLAVNGFSLDENASQDERYITHILSRSLLENYFAILYLFDDPAKMANRFEELKNSFKEDYRKLIDELKEPLLLPFFQKYQNQLEAADPTWRKLLGLPDVRTMLGQVTNDYGDRLSYLYFIYRITSFDTHGRSLSAIFDAVFSKKSNFPVLKIKHAFELIANEYLIVLNNLRRSGRIV
jgi:hypothetical protein